MDALSLGNDVKQEEEKDVIRKGGYIKDTGIYDGQLDVIYLEKTTKGSLMAKIVVTLDDGSKVTDDECIMTNKSGTLLPYTIDKKGEKRALIGYNRILGFLRTVGSDVDLVDLGAADCEKKVIKIYDFDERAEVPKEKTVFMDAFRVPVKVGIIKEVNDKRVQNSEGEWVASGEVRESNKIDRIFTKDGLTRAEIKNDATEPKYLNEWQEAFPSDYVKDNSKGAGKKEGKTGRPSDNKPAPSDDLDI